MHNSVCSRLTRVAMLRASVTLPSILSTKASTKISQHILPVVMHRLVRSRPPPKYIMKVLASFSVALRGLTQAKPTYATQPCIHASLQCLCMLCSKLISSTTLRNTSVICTGRCGSMAVYCSACNSAATVLIRQSWYLKAWACAGGALYCK